MGDERDDGSDERDDVSTVGDDGNVRDDGNVGDEGTVGDDGVAGHVLPDEVEYPEPEEGASTALPRRVESWRRRSAAGAMLTGFAFGLREAFEPTFNEPAIVLETSGTPPKDLPVEADLDNGPPRQSVVRIRRWLLADVPDGATAESGGPGAAGSVDGQPTDGQTANGQTTDGQPTDGRDPDGSGDTTGTAAPVRTTEIRSRQSTGRRRGVRSARFGRREGKRS